MEGGGALGGAFLPDDVGDAGVQLLLDLLGGQVAAVAVVLGGHAGSLLDFVKLLQAVLVAEAIVGVAAFHQLQGVFLEHAHALALDVGAHGAADVGAFVPDQAGLFQGVVDDVHRALDVAGLVGVLDAEDEGAVIFLGDKVGVQRSAQVSDVHIAGGAGREPGADFFEIHFRNPSI